MVCLDLFTAALVAGRDDGFQNVLLLEAKELS
jgi:hypothetical protein